MELKRYLNLAKRWWWLMVLLALVGGVGGYLGGANEIIVYRAATTLLIYQAPGALPDASTVAQGQRVADTYAQLLQQRPVLEQVIANLNLRMDPDSLKGKLAISEIGDTNLLQLAVTDSDPQRAADIANEIVHVFIEQNVAVQDVRYSDSLDNLKSQMDLVQKDITDTQAALDQLTANVAVATLTPDSAQERNRLQSLIADYRNSYAILLDRYEQIRLAQAQATDRVSVVEAALPGRPIPPRSRSLLALQAGLVGLALGVGVVLLIEYLNDSVDTREEVERLTGAPVMGIVGVIQPTGVPSDALVTVHDPQSSVAESYRLLSANLETATAGEAVRVLVVTSSTPLEGKTTTAANLAVSLAQGGWRVILVDLDLRRPMLHELFEQPNRTGVSVATLQPGSSATEFLAPVAVDNLYLMTSGPLPPNVPEVLRSTRMVELITELKAHADMVILDTPPLLVVADPILLARLADAVLLVVRAEQTKAGDLRQAVEIVTQSGAKLVGAVLNRVRSRNEGYYYYDYYYRSSSDRGRASRR